jgi:hypothetical protein
MNQYNPSYASTDAFLPKDREGAAFHSSCRVQPCATPVEGMENKYFLDIQTTTYVHLSNFVPPYVG